MSWYWSACITLYVSLQCVCLPTIPEGPWIIPFCVCLLLMHACTLQVDPTRERADGVAATAADGCLLVPGMASTLTVLGQLQGYDMYAYCYL